MITASFIGGAVAFALGYLACMIHFNMYRKEFDNSIRIRDESIERQKRIEMMVNSLWLSISPMGYDKMTITFGTIEGDVE